MSSKKCSSCGEVKAYADFNRDNGHPTGRQTYCRPCESIHHVRNNAKSNPNRMYVNGKYIPKTHPLHKPGRYKTFGEAAFDQMMEGKDSPGGYVYIITNPAFPDWVKVGLAVDAEDRLRGYQTSSPFRDYELYQSYAVTDRRAAEAAAHDILKGQYTKANEWFRCSPAAADILIRGTMEDMASDGTRSGHRDEWSEPYEDLVRGGAEPDDERVQVFHRPGDILSLRTGE